MYKILIAVLLAGCSINMAKAIEEKTYEVRWKEDKQGQIIHSSVCWNYSKGSADFRGCRGQAQQLFKQRCSEARQNRNATKDREKFCNAASTYNPILR